ncbi:hypothetical protein BDP67DRAFT_512698 [Colletotrichum lupini]|nr:hypothetical protein BDP67DRAFT_512698 [Colletotrichum lupini]
MATSRSSAGLRTEGSGLMMTDAGDRRALNLASDPAKPARASRGCACRRYRSDNLLVGWGFYHALIHCRGD